MTQERHRFSIVWGSRIETYQHRYLDTSRRWDVAVLGYRSSTADVPTHLQIARSELRPARRNALPVCCGVDFLVPSSSQPREPKGILSAYLGMRPNPL